MTIKEDIKSMFWEPAVDYASSIIPFDESPDENEQQLLWDKIHRAYTKGVDDVLEYVFNNYNIYGSANQTKSTEDLKKCVDAVVYCQCEEPDRDSGYIYCQRCHKNVSPARMRFLVEKDEMFEIPAEEPDPETLKRIKLRENFEYNDMCARATLHPGKSIDEVKVIQFNSRIEAAYTDINERLCNSMPFNEPHTREWVISALKNWFGTNCFVKCNDENNPPDVVDQSLLIAQVTWNSDYSREHQHKHVSMIFGDKERVERYQTQHLLDIANTWIT